MSWFNKQTDHAYYDLLLNECSKEKKKYKTAKINVYVNIENEPFIFDLNALTPFSIERVLDENGIPVTCIGYFSRGKNKSVAREWYIRCSSEKHKELIKQFEKYIINKYN